METQFEEKHLKSNGQEVCATFKSARTKLAIFDLFEVWPKNIDV